MTSPETISGVVFAALALTSAIAALFVSRLSDRIGYRNALALTTLGAGAAYLPVAIATDTYVLVGLMALVGLFSGGMLPTANAIIDLLAPPGRQASAFGLMGSATALSFAIAPLAGGAIASAAGLHASFLVIGGTLLAIGGAVLVVIREPSVEAAPTAETAHATSAPSDAGE